MKRLQVFTFAVFLIVNVWSVNPQKTFILLEMNTENFFDCSHDEGKEDEDFLPNGPRRWNWGRYRIKLRNISKAIAGADGKGLPDAVALEEVENNSVLTDLTKRSILRQAHYSYIMTQSADRRGIDVALLYRPEMFRLLHWNSVSPRDEHGIPLKTRDLLCVEGRMINGDTLHILVCHLSSKITGRQGRINRQRELAVIRETVDSIQKKNEQSNIVITGDFNDIPEHISASLNAEPPQDGNINIYAERLYNLTQSSGIIPSGTYKYDGKWEMLDQCLVTGSLLLPDKHLRAIPQSIKPCAQKFLLVPDEETDGMRPKHTYVGFRYEGGYCDHLPLSITFELNLNKE